MSVFAAPVNPGRALGILVLGTSLHDILTRLKAEPLVFPKLDLVYSPSQPVEEPVILNLPQNGIRLRFDGSEQRLRLIEVLDFSKSKLTYKGKEVWKPASTGQLESEPEKNSTGPYFRHVYQNLLGPTFPGEYIPPTNGDGDHGTYVLSYPGIAFSFPLLNSAWKPQKDFVSLLSSSAQPAASLAIFIGDSWVGARRNLYTQKLEDPRNFAPPSKARDTYADEVGMVKIFGQGRLELTRPWSSMSVWLTLGESTPQDLVAELGPPDAIYRKQDQRMLIHKERQGSEHRPRRPTGLDDRSQDDLTDTDQSSAHTTTDMSEEETDAEELAEHGSGECFFNYFYQGFDILISRPTAPSRRPPSLANILDNRFPRPTPIDASASLVATKIIIHGNVPGSYSFNRHRRCRWEIVYLTRDAKPNETVINSETLFEEVAKRLHKEWESDYSSDDDFKQRERGMVLNRGWGDSPSSSVELLGGWEDSAGGKRVNGPSAVLDEEQGLGNTTLYGFPGLVFEVLKNGTISGLTVF